MNVSQVYFLLQVMNEKTAPEATDSHIIIMRELISGHLERRKEASEWILSLGSLLFRWVPRSLAVKGMPSAWLPGVCGESREFTWMNHMFSEILL